MERNEYRVELIIHTSSDHPHEITNILEIKPTEIYVKGEQWYTPFTKKPIEGKYNANNIWIYSTDKLFASPGERTYLDTSIRDLLTLLKEKREKLKEILQRYPSSYFVCYAYYYDSHEYFKIDRALLAELSYYETDIIFDSYNLSKPDQELG